MEPYCGNSIYSNKEGTNNWCTCSLLRTHSEGN